MKKVVAVGKYGNIVMAEDKESLHNDIVYSMFEDFLEPLKDEKVEGDLINIWPNAGLVTKYLEMMVYLEDIKDEMINSVVCIIPKDLSERQLEYYEDNYKDSIDTFIGIYCDGDKFKLIGSLSNSGD